MMSKIKAGVRYGQLVFVDEVPSRRRGQLWRFRCDCGKETVKRASQVKNGAVSSCGGCSLGYKERNFRRRQRALKSTKRFSPEYLAWMSMRSLQRDGGRRVTVCAQWASSFETFLADMGHKPSPQHVLSRLDQDGNFEPGNCRWACGERHAQQRDAFEDARAA
jgi:hypothetical protein